MKNIKLTLIALIALTSVLTACSQPSTEVYILNLRRSSEAIVLENPTNISDNEGYDNQPSFWSDSESILYARNMDGQTEIVRFYPESENMVRITKTTNGSEYSPTLMPDGRISSIRLDTDGLQLLYSYSLKGDSEVLVPELKIGYHAWINDEEIIAFVLGEPSTLQRINTVTDKATILAENIGRSLHKVPGTNSFSFMVQSDEKWVIKSMDQKTGETNILTEAYGESQDYCWTPQGEIITGSGSKLFIWKEGEKWTEIADLSSKGITGITRITVSPDGKKIAIVGE